MKSKKAHMLLLTLLAMTFATTRAEKQKEAIKSNIQRQTEKQTEVGIDDLRNIPQTKVNKSLKELLRAIGDAPGNIATSILAGSVGKKNAPYDYTIVKIIATIIAVLPFVATTEACGSRTKEYFDDFSANPIQNGLKIAIYGFGTGIGAFCTSAVTLSLVMHIRKKLP